MLRRFIWNGRHRKGFHSNFVSQSYDPNDFHRRKILKFQILLNSYNPKEARHGRDIPAFPWWPQVWFKGRLPVGGRSCRHTSRWTSWNERHRCPISKEQKGTDAKDHKTQLYFLDIYRWLPRGRKVYMIQGNILTTATTSEKVAAAKSNNCWTASIRTGTQTSSIYTYAYLLL